MVYLKSRATKSCEITGKTRRSESLLVQRGRNFLGVYFLNKKQTLSFTTWKRIPLVYIDHHNGSGVQKIKWRNKIPPFHSHTRAFSLCITNYISDFSHSMPLNSFELFTVSQITSVAYYLNNLSKKNMPGYTY